MASSRIAGSRRSCAVAVSSRDPRMKSILALALAAVVSSSGLAACSGAHGASATVPGTTPQSAQGHVRHLQGARSVRDLSGGSPPRFFLLDILLFDAPLVG